MDLTKAEEIGSWDKFKLFKWNISAKEMINLFERDKGKFFFLCVCLCVVYLRLLINFLPYSFVELNPERNVAVHFVKNYLRKQPEAFVCNGLWLKQTKSLINVGDQIWAQKIRITVYSRKNDPVVIEESGVSDSIKKSRAIAFAKIKTKVDELAPELDDSINSEFEYFDASSFCEAALWEDTKPAKVGKKRKKEETCLICERSFCDKYYVEDHMLSVHEVACPFPGCRELFKTRANLNNHFLHAHNLNIRGLSLQELLYISVAAQEEETKSPPSSPRSLDLFSSYYSSNQDESASNNFSRNDKMETSPA